MKLGIQMHLAGLSLSNTASVLESLGVKRVHSIIHNWVHKADLQPDSGNTPNQVAVDEKWFGSTKGGTGCTWP